MPSFLQLNIRSKLWWLPLLPIPFLPLDSSQICFEYDSIDLQPDLKIKILLHICTNIWVLEKVSKFKFWYASNLTECLTNIIVGNALNGLNNA